MIDPSLFPQPDSPYATNGLRYDRLAPLSLLAFHLSIIKAPGNLHHAQRKSGYYFFRDSNVPLPRPATALAWNRLVRLGSIGSRSFAVPFLPSLRAEDELGQAISEKGIHLVSLGRRSPLHIKERAVGDSGPYDAILWGDIFIGRIPESLDRCNHTLTGRVERSNITESLIVPRSDISGATAQDSIRSRMEFLAQYGLLATREFARQSHLPVVNRLMFQILDARAAFAWADEYSRCMIQISADPGLIEADYREMLESMKQQAAESEEAEAEENVEKRSTKRADKMDFSSISL